MKTKKVGIVTFHTGNNYGAVLQAYALQEYVSKLGYEVKIMDFNPTVYDTYDKIFKHVNNNWIKNLLHQLLQLLHYSELKKRRIRFEEFQKANYKKTSKRYLTEEDFLTNHELFDCYISGSDQVFNPRVKFSDVYFLSFEKLGSKKIAYAPSFGISEFTAEEKDRIRRHVADFDFLSCRESSGAYFLSKLLGKPIPTVCDPVFLLDKNEWINIAKRPGENKPYIFVYDLNGGQKLIDIAKKVSESYHIENIVCATLNTHSNYRGVKSIRSLGPRELLGFINNADYIVTDSFHGTSLSLVMGKKVIPYIALAKASSRIESVMEKLGISGQIIRTLDGCKDINSIQFKQYTKELDEYIKESKMFLQESLQ